MVLCACCNFMFAFFRVTLGFLLRKSLVTCSRPLGSLKDKGCVLEEGGDQASLNIRESLSFPVSVIDLGKVRFVFVSFIFSLFFSGFVFCVATSFMPLFSITV